MGFQDNNRYAKMRNAALEAQSLYAEGSGYEMLSTCQSGRLASLDF